MWFLQLARELKLCHISTIITIEWVLMNYKAFTFYNIPVVVVVVVVVVDVVVVVVVVV